MAKLLDGRVFTPIFAAIFAVVVWFTFWKPNSDVARSVVEERIGGDPTEQTNLDLPLSVRVTVALGGPIEGATLRWLGPHGGSGEATTDADGKALLVLPALGRYELTVDGDEVRGFRPAKIVYRYKIGAERVEASIPVQPIKKP